MSTAFTSKTTEANEAVANLFDNSSPILVEVRFPNMGTASDWYLCEEEEQVQEILDKVGTGVELYLNSVWELQSGKDELCVKKA